jgi:hypothetical protein
MTEPGIPADRVETADSRLRMGQLLIAVIVGAGIWNLIVSLFNCVIVPWIGGVMGPNSSLPASFTERPYDYPDLFVAVLEFAVAGLVAVGLNALLMPRKKVVRMKVVRKPVPAPVPEVARIIPEAAPLPPAPPQPVPMEAKPVSQMAASVPAREFEIAPPSPPPVRPTPPPQPPLPSVRPAPAPPAPVVPPVQAAAAPPPASPPKVKPEPAKPKKPKQVYYNLVGEPVESDDD